MSRIFRSKGLRDREKRVEKQRVKNGQKKYDPNNRLRNKTVAFRLTPEEYDLLNDLVESSGLIKQDYIIQALTKHAVTYVGSPKMAKGISAKLDDILAELKRITNASQINEEQLIYIEKIMGLKEKNE